MSTTIDEYSIFANGSCWLKTDFHLHTKADKEFKYSGDDNSFSSDYVNKLKQQSINIGIITNHNKFDWNEYKALKKKAKREEILLLPGVELSVNDGANGIHTLVVFSEQWLENGNDYINQFLGVVFEGKTPAQYEQENGRSSYNLIDTIKKLNGYHKDYFLVFAHVEQNSGLWHELDGGRIEELATNKYFKQRTLGFQKVRTNDKRTKVKEWFKDWYPAELEGSDNKSIEQIGKNAKETWLKIGDFTFEAIKYALADHASRVANEQPQNCQHSHIKSISFEGGVLDKQQIDFSPELNSLIGIRGSGKSSIVEAIRYLLNISFGDKTIDKEYKDSLVAHTLGSGGKVIIAAVDKHGQDYNISRILNEQPEVFIDGELQIGISIRETIIHKPIYFGQKDLSRSGEGFEKDLVEKLLGDKLTDIRRQINNQKAVISQQCDKLNSLSNIDEKITENIDKQKDAQYRLKIFQDNGIEDKLQKQTDFNTDDKKIKIIINSINEYKNALTEVINQYEDELKNHCSYQSKQNKAFFSKFFDIYQIELKAFDNIKIEVTKIREQLAKLQDKSTVFSNLKKEQLNQFAQVRRELEADLKTQGKQLNLEEFPKLQRTIETTKQLLESLSKESKKTTVIKYNLIINLSKLNDLWRQEYKLIEAELVQINQNHTALQISSEYKGDKDAFLEYFKRIFRGSHIRENNLQKIVSDYADFTAIYQDLNNVKALAKVEIFEQYFTDNIKKLLNWQVPNKFVIKYHGKELQNHSLGQRASALILFVLSQKENHLVMIDQPEDDLDNQTIYEDVIKLVRKLKPKTQFIFATHNANFPVLGDSEQIHACEYSDESMKIKSGSIDSPIIQQEIVNIMEGGEDAFNKRKEIYQIWKPQNS